MKGENGYDSYQASRTFEMVTGVKIVEKAIWDRKVPIGELDSIPHRKPG
jgi:hypothetical protein